MTADQDDDRLEALLQAARGAEPVDEALFARVLADAEGVQQALRPQPVLPLRRAGSWPGFWAQISDALGGWPGLSGVTAAGVAGLALGFFAPDLVDGLSGGQIAIWSGDLGTIPEIGLLWEDAGDV